jgi:multimeric flavodoxin WrbA
MKIMALNSSPRGEGQSKTELMLNHLVEGMRYGEAEVNVVHLRKKKIKNCIGCFTCWTKTPGQCTHNDDMSVELLPEWLNSDIAIYATPLYNYSMNARLKVFIERTLPSMEPFFKFHDGRMYHPLRHKVPGIVMLSVSGMPDKEHFNMLSDHMNYMLSTPGRRLLAEIYRPSAEIMTSPFFQEKAKEILDATTQAGKELAMSMQISSETLGRIMQPIVEEESFALMGDLYWKTCIAEGVTPKQFKAQKLIPRPDSLETFMILFPSGINTEAAGEKKTVLQFDFSGEVNDSCHFTIQNDRTEATSGSATSPDITIETPFDTWMDIMTGKADGQQLFMEQKYKVNGDLALMIQLFQKP